MGVAWNTVFVGILVVAVDAWTTGNSIDRDEYSVVIVMDTSGAHAGGAGTAIWAWRICPLVVPIETIRIRSTSAYCVRKNAVVSSFSVACAGFHGVRIY